MTIISRIAPTPSGFLHLGNAYNFLLTAHFVEQRGGRLWLRIDDVDAPRVREEYIEDIFSTLEWLGIQCHDGPGSVEEFHKKFSLQHHQNFYSSRLQEFLEKSSRLFACECSRSQVRKLSPEGIYPGTCRDKDLVLKKDVTALRFKVEGEQLKEHMGDFVVWRKDDLPAYQFFSLVEDIRMGVNTIIRGEDLHLSTMAQQELAQDWGLEEFLQCRFYHHDLVTTDSGEKFSKSQGHSPLKKNQQEKDWLEKKVETWLENPA